MIDTTIIDGICRLLIERERPGSLISFDDLKDADKDVLRQIVKNSITGVDVQQSVEGSKT